MVGKAQNALGSVVGQGVASTIVGAVTTAVGVPVVPALDPVAEEKIKTIIGDGKSRLILVSGTTSGIILSDIDLRGLAMKLTGSPENPSTYGRTLSLTSCGITDAGLRALLEGLKEHPGALAALDLSGNDIGDAGAAVIAEYIPHMPSLRFLILKGTNISENGLLTIIRAIGNAGHNAIQFIDCPDLINVSEQGIKSIATEMERCPAASFCDGVNISGYRVQASIMPNLINGQNILLTSSSSPSAPSQLVQNQYAVQNQPGYQQFPQAPAMYTY
ncbi:MAG: hypothetical protein LBJ92_03855 [Holosporales bacterium]|nr:hypothetical protein [Holosporales bacterium]